MQPTAYSNINVHAIGAYSSLDTLLYQLIYYIFHNYLKINDPKLELEIQILLKAVNLYLSRKLIALKIVDKLSPTLKQELASGILNIVFRKYPEILLQTGILQGLISILNLIFDELNFNVVALSYDFLNDFLVDLPSQLGYDGQSTNEYKGFKHKNSTEIAGTDIQIRTDTVQTQIRIHIIFPDIIHSHHSLPLAAGTIQILK